MLCGLCVGGSVEDVCGFVLFVTKIWYRKCQTETKITEVESKDNANQVTHGKSKDNEREKSVFYRLLDTVQTKSTETSNELDTNMKALSNKNSKDNDRGDYFLYTLLRMLQTKSKYNLKQLDNNIKELSNKNRDGWNGLIEWDTNSDNKENNKNNNDNSSVIRQDTIETGIISRYKETDLLHNTTSTFNSDKFCDFNDYLPKLVLLAHMVDDELHKSIRNTFNINKTDGKGYLKTETQDEKDSTINVTTTAVLSINVNKFDNESKIDNNVSNTIEYTSGAVKLYQRALNKSENDFYNELFATSACVLDFNRCTLTFNSMNTLLNSLDVFLNKVKNDKCGNIIKIVGCKNTFKNYVSEGVQYADIKLNVIIKGKINNIIGEVQFLLLLPMSKFKLNAHNLYSIERKKAFVESTLTLILARLLDIYKQFFIAGIIGYVKKMCETMILNHTGHVRALKCFQSIVDDDKAFGKNVFIIDGNNFTILETMIIHKKLDIIKLVLSSNEIKDKILKNQYWLYRMLWWLFGGKYDSRDIIDFVINELKLIKNVIIDLIENYRYKEKEMVMSFSTFISIVDKDVFSKFVFLRSRIDITAFETAICFNKIEMIKYMDY